MTNFSFRRILLAAVLLMPAGAALVAVMLGRWPLAAAAATVQITVVGLLSALALGEVRALKRRAERQSKKFNHFAKAVNAGRAKHQRVLREIRAVRGDVSHVRSRTDRLTTLTKVTLERAEQAERRVIGVAESLRLEVEPIHEFRPQISAMQGEIKADLEALQEAVTTSAASAARDTINKTVSRLTSVARDETRQVEALLQLLPTIKPSAPLPPSGQWAMDARALLHLSHLCRTVAPRNLLELGGGTSTVWLAYLLQEHQTSITSVDHDPLWAKLTQEALERHALAVDVALRVAPLEPIDFAGQTFTWYDAAAFEDLTNIDFLLIDGPPKASGPLARYPALPALHGRLSHNCTVVLDDSERPDEVRTIERWLEEFGEFTRIQEGMSRLSVLRRGGPPAAGL